MDNSEAEQQPLTAEDIARRLATAHVSEEAGSSDKPKRWALTSLVVDNLVGFIQNPSERWYLGIPEVDIATRGVGRGELMLVVGRSHTGKSQVLLNSIVSNLVNNPASHIVIFSMDEPRELVVMKLFCLLRGKSSDVVENLIKEQDKEILDDLERAAKEELSRVAIITGVTTKAQAVKRWAKTQRVPVGLVHQAGRGSGDKGKAAGIYAGRYGGEQEAIFVLEVYRQKDRYDLSEWEKKYHANSVNLNLCKNKRTARLNDQVYYIDPECGHVHPYWEELIPDVNV